MRIAIASKTALLLTMVSVVTAAHRAETGLQASGRLTDPQFVSEGARLFATSCGNAYCHGTGAMGGGGPRLRDRGLESSFVFKAVSNGIPGTSMPSFKTELSEEQIWKLVAFIASSVKSGASVPGSSPSPIVSSPTAPVKPADTAVATTLAGSAQAGKAIFFDSSRPKSCQACHSFNGEGTSIGPDLTSTAGRTPRDLFLSITLVPEIKDPKYATISISLRSGEKVVGVKKEEDEESFRVYDTTELPAVLRTVQKADAAKVEYSNQSAMPKDYASTYTLKQLLDLVTFLKSSESKSSVTLKDLLD